jgi:hypothetical protein
MVERVLHAGVHALTARRAVDVRGVAREEHPSPPVLGHLAVVDLKAGHPVRSRNGDAADAFVDDLLKLFGGGRQIQRGTGRVVDLGEEPHPFADHRQRDDRAVRVEIGVHVRVVETWFDFDVAENETLALERAMKLGAHQMSHTAVAAVGADDPRGVDLLGRTVGSPQYEVHDVVVLCQSRQLNASVDGHPQRGQVFGQHAFGLGLCGYQGVGECAVYGVQGCPEHLLAVGEHVHSG